MALRFVLLLGLMNSGTAGSSQRATAQTPETGRDSTTRDSILPLLEVRARHVRDYQEPGQLYVFDSTALQAFEGETISRLLQDRTPAYLREYGPGLAGISLRGTGSNHTTVLWNGLPIRYPTLGQVDFSTLPVSGIDQMEVYPGGGSTDFGSGAIGGAVRLRQRARFYPHQSLTAGGALGSYEAGDLSINRQYLRWRRGARHRSWALYLGRAEDHATYAPHAHNRRWNFSGHYHGRTSDSATQWGVYANYIDLDRKLTPAQGTARNQERQQDRQGRLVLEAKHHRGNWRFHAQGGYFRDRLNYANRSLRSRSLAHTVQGRLEAEWRPNAHWQLLVGALPRWVQADVTAYQRPRRRWESSYYAWARYRPDQHWTLQAKWRQAVVTGYNPPPTPSFSAAYAAPLNARWLGRVFAKASRNYRVPSFNDLYWPRLGNPGLRPEEAWQTEAGLEGRWRLGPQKLSATISAYTGRVANWIQWQPAQEGWNPYNAKEVLHRGFEAVLRGATSISAHWQLQAEARYARNYAEVLNSRQPELFPEGRQLMYTPFDNYSAQLRISHRQWRYRLGYQYTGFRYTDPSATQAILPAYGLWNASLSRTLFAPSITDKEKNSATLLLRATVRNVFNVDYQSYSGYPMPGRHSLLNLSITL
jgi:iron complex outermembrane receptor protein